MAKKDLLDTAEKVVIFESPLKLDKLIYSKKDNLWRSKIVVDRVESMHDQVKANITLNQAPFLEAIDRIEREIQRAKETPDLFDNAQVKELQTELKDEQKDLAEKVKKFGEINFVAFIESLAQKDNRKTQLTLVVPKDIVADFMEKIHNESDFISAIEFYI